MGSRAEVPLDPEVPKDVIDILKDWKDSTGVPAVTNHDYYMLQCNKVLTVHQTFEKLRKKDHLNRPSKIREEMDQLAKFMTNAALPFVDEACGKAVQRETGALEQYSLIQKHDKFPAFLSSLRQCKIRLLVGEHGSYFEDLASAKIKTLVPETERLEAYLNLCKWKGRSLREVRDVLLQYLDFRDSFQSCRIYKVIQNIESIPESERWVGHSFLVDVIATNYDLPQDVLDRANSSLREGRERFRKQFSILKDNGYLDSVRQRIEGCPGEQLDVMTNSLVRREETLPVEEEPTRARPLSEAQQAEDQNKSQADDQRTSQADDQRTSQIQDPTKDPTKEIQEIVKPAATRTRRQMEKQAELDGKVGRDPEWKRARGIPAVGKYLAGTKIPLPSDSHKHKTGKKERTNTPVDDLKNTAKTGSIQDMKDDSQVFRTSGQQAYEIKDEYAWILLEEMIQEEDGKLSVKHSKLSLTDEQLRRICPEWWMILDLVDAGEVPGTKKCIDVGSKPPKESRFAPSYMTSASANPDFVTLKGVVNRLDRKIKRLNEKNKRLSEEEKVLRTHVESLESRVERLENIQSGKRGASALADGCGPEKRPALES